MCVCVREIVIEIERERERKRTGQRERQREVLAIPFRAIPQNPNFSSRIECYHENLIVSDLWVRTFVVSSECLR